MTDVEIFERGRNSRIAMRYRMGLTCNEIGKQFGLTKTRIAQIVSKEEEKMGRILRARLCLQIFLRRPEDPFED
jgi:DNA-directed RNA polymerase sigma subunit (sigma70/sigma32)